MKYPTVLIYLFIPRKSWDGRILPVTYSIDEIFIAYNFFLHKIKKETIGVSIKIRPQSRRYVTSTYPYTKFDKEGETINKNVGWEISGLDCLVKKRSSIDLNENFTHCIFRVRVGETSLLPSSNKIEEKRFFSMPLNFYTVYLGLYESLFSWLFCLISHPHSTCTHSLHSHRHIFTLTRVHVHTLTPTYTRILSHRHVLTPTHVHTLTFTHTLTYSLHSHTDSHTDSHTRTRTHSHSHVHTHLHPRRHINTCVGTHTYSRTLTRTHRHIY